MALPTIRRTRPLNGWDPFQGFEDLLRAVEGTSGVATQNGTWLPAADVSETEQEYVVEVETPGIKREDIKIDVAQHVLSVSGERKETQREGVFRRRSRRSGRFSYRLTLPRDIDTDKVEAKLDDGVLTVRVPKTASAQPREIEISS